MSPDWLPQLKKSRCIFLGQQNVWVVLLIKMDDLESNYLLTIWNIVFGLASEWEEKALLAQITQSLCLSITLNQITAPVHRKRQFLIVQKSWGCNQVFWKLLVCKLSSFVISANILVFNKPSQGF